jgi:archaellum component FlaC
MAVNMHTVDDKNERWMLNYKAIVKLYSSMTQKFEPVNDLVHINWYTE